jgi:F-type H+-transporting ATPase subunit b
MELLFTNEGLPIWMTITFGIVVFILGKYAWKPILQSLKDREEEIDGAIQLAEETKAEMAKMKSQNEDLLKEAREEREKIIKIAKTTGDKMIAEAKSTAAVEGQKMVEKAKAEIEQQTTLAMAELKKEVSTLSISMAEKIIGKKFEDPKEQSQYIEQRLKDLETMPKASKN